MLKHINNFVISGTIGITTDTSWQEPKTDAEDDKYASEMAMQFYVSFLLKM